jgi:hypothetical protein
VNGHNGHSIFDPVGAGILLVRPAVVAVKPMRRLQIEGGIECVLENRIKPEESVIVPLAVCLGCHTMFCFGHLLTHPCYPKPWDGTAVALIRTWSRNSRPCHLTAQYRRE